MGSLKVGDIVEYGGNAYYLYSIRSGDICTIVRIRDGSIFNEKNGEKRYFTYILIRNYAEEEQTQNDDGLPF